MVSRRKIGVPTAEGIDDVWLRRATGAAIVAVRDVIKGGAIPPAAPLNRLSDIELGWLIAAGLFAWIRIRAEQATAEGMDTELALRLTGLDPEPWDAGAVLSALPEIGSIEGIDWGLPVASWSKDMVVKFLLGALPLVRNAMIARDVGGGVTSRKSLTEMQRIARAEVGGSLLAPGELDDALPFSL
jgi:hypothetical protein